ncbi:hypothetical protein JCM10450v2_003621 [Rhodotorula kratochvilovae]
MHPHAHPPPLHNGASPHLHPLAPPPPPPQQQHPRPPLPQTYSNAQQHQHHGLNPQDTRTQLFVSNLPFRARWQDLKDLMRKCGTVLRADVALNPTDGRGFGVVLFAKAEDAAKAIATYHGYTWQTRVLDVRIDAQDPTGALALAEANRQQAIQNQQKLLEQRARNSPIPPPPPPPMGLVAAPYGAMLVPVQGANGQTFLAAAAAPPPPPPPASDSAASPYLSPAVVRTSSQEHTAQRASSPARSPSPSGRSAASPASAHFAHGDLPPHGTLDRAASDSLLLASQRSPPLGSPSPLLRPAHVPPQQQSQPQQFHNGHGQDLPPQLQHAVALVPPPPPPPPHHHPHQMQQQMLVPMVSIHPMGYAVPGGLVQYYAAQQGGAPMPPRPGSAPPSGIHPHPHPHGMGMGPGPGPGPGQYTNRHLFVGNLPFNCQWQELKDLMRGAGSVLRADIAQGPDGRSRGFGSVLFATPQDAERAVQMFNGHEFNGRTLKVHFDKFSGAAVNNPPPHHQHSPQHPFQPQHGHHGPPPPPPPMPYGNGQQQQFGGPVPVPYRPQTLEHLVAQPAQAPSPLSQLAHAPSPASSRPGTAVTRPGSSLSDGRSPHAAPAPPRTAPSPIAAAASSSPLSSSFPDGSRGVTAPTAAAPSPPAPSFARGHSHPAAPSRIAMPPPLPFSLSMGMLPAGAAGAAQTPASAGPGGGGGGPFSPLRTHGLPPMTPSMPAFTFGGAGPFAAQPTPPLLPHGMFSPGVGVGFGPFSPGTPGAMSPGAFFASAWGSAARPAPAAANVGFNPMFPAYPYTPGHHLAHGHGGAHVQHAHAGVPATAVEEEEGHEEEHEAEETTPVQDEPAAADAPSYFPCVPPPATASDAPLPRRGALAEAKAATTSASAPPLSPDLGPRVLASAHSKSEGTVAALGRAFDGLSVESAGAGAAPAPAGTRSLQSSPRVSPPALPQGGERGWAEGSPPTPAEAGAGRRASVDGGAKRAAFGTSIWG